MLKVDGAGFKQCMAPAGTAALTSGNDVITLATPGRKWYICGVGQHCEVGNQKLVITVLDQVSSPAPSPSTPPTPNQDQPSAATTSRLSLMLLIITGVLGVFFA